MDMDIMTVNPGKRTGRIGIPSSKSLAHRALICRALADQCSGIVLDGFSADIKATMNCLKGLGAEISIHEGVMEITPVKWFPEAKQSLQAAQLPCSESGSTLRFLLPVAGALGREAVFVMEGRLSERPMERFEQVLIDHGMKIRRDGRNLYCSGKLEPGEYKLPGNISSQYISGLLFALPLLDGSSRIRIETDLESADYVKLTEGALHDAGIIWETTQDGYLIPGRQCYHISAATKMARIEGDYSAAAFFLCAGAFSQQGITVHDLSPDSRQGDRRILEELERFGALVEVQGREVTVRKGQLKETTIDGSMIPDLIPVLSVVAAGVRGTTRIYNAARLRMKESDRIMSTCRMLQSLGADVRELQDGLIIYGNGELKGGALVDPYRDHRIAMSAAVGACICSEPVMIKDAECVGKSYPDFWEDFGSLGME